MAAASAGEEEDEGLEGLEALTGGAPEEEEGDSCLEAAKSRSALLFCTTLRLRPLFVHLFMHIVYRGHVKWSRGCAALRRVRNTERMLWCSLGKTLYAICGLHELVLKEVSWCGGLQVPSVALSRRVRERLQERSPPSRAGS